MTDDEREIKRIACKEARYTVDHHINRIQKIDDKASRLFRLNVMLFGGLLTIITIILNIDEVTLSPFINIWSIAGVIALIISVIFSAVTYTSSGYDLGVSSNFINKVQSDAYNDTDDFYSEICQLYKGWIDYNKNMGDFNIYLLTIAILSMFDGIMFLLGGSIIGLVEYENWMVSSSLFIVTLLVILMLDYIFWKSDAIYAELRNGK